MIRNIEASFLKVSAAGNRFLISDGVPPFSGKLLSEKIKLWCSAPEGFATDGCLWLEQRDDNIYKWHFFNNDGSSAEMCGNAACSAVYYLHLKGVETKNLKFETISGLVNIAEGKDNFPLNFAISLNKPKFLEKSVNISIDQKSAMGPWIDSGVPHIILEKDLTNFPTAFDWERKVRFADHFKPRGTNVTYVDLNKTPVRAVTYERGVENYTEACGTGALAAAYFIFEKSNVNPIFIEMPGGKLKVTFHGNMVTLQSPVKLHGEVNIYKD